MRVSDLLGYEDYITKIKREQKPVVVYGMGDGAERIIAHLRKNGIEFDDLFASDEFVRGQEFMGKRVKALDDILKKYKGKRNFCIVSAFALEGEGCELFFRLAREYTFYAPNLPPYGEGCIDKAYLSEFSDNVEKVFNSFYDDYSKNLFVSLLIYNITADISFISGFNLEEPPEGWYTHNGVHIDIGAFDGDTVLGYAFHSLNYQKILAVEPDTRSFRRLLESTASLRDIECVNAAAWSRDGTGDFCEKGSRGSSAVISGNGSTIFRSVDSLCGQPFINSDGLNVGSIKIDGEGAEEEIISGAVNVIYRHSPMICCAVYHRAFDLFDIVKYLRIQNPSYRFFLRCKKYVPAFDVFVYAVRDSSLSGFY